MKQLYPECSSCTTEMNGLETDVCDSGLCPGKRNASYRKEIEALSKRCIGCPDNGRNHERCDYSCQIGFQIHKYDSLMGGGNHKKW